MLPSPVPINQTWRITRAVTVAASEREYTDLISGFRPEHRHPGGLGVLFFESPLYGSMYIDTLANGAHYMKQISDGIPIDLRLAAGAVYAGWDYSPAWERYRPDGPWFRDSREGIIFASECVVTYEADPHKLWPGGSRTPDSDELAIRMHCMVCHDGHPGWVSNAPSNREDMAKLGVNHHSRRGVCKPGGFSGPASQKEAARVHSLIARQMRGEAVPVEGASALTRPCPDCKYIVELAAKQLVAKIYE